MQKRNGYTLIELLVYLAITGIISVSLGFGINYLDISLECRNNLFLSYIREELERVRMKSLVEMKVNSYIIREGDSFFGYKFVKNLVITFNVAGIIVKGTESELNFNGDAYTLNIEPVTGKINLRKG